MKKLWNNLSRRHRKLSLWVLGLVVAYTVIGFLILPPIIRSVAAKKLSAELDRRVSIAKVRLNPYVLSITIRGLLVEDRDAEPFVSWDEVYVNFQLSSLFRRAWVFREIRTDKPFVRVQMNKDYTFNFSDLLEKYSTNAPSAEPSKPLSLRVYRLQVSGASASFTDLTPREPFRRVLGPLDVTLEGFRTDPDNRNPYSFSGSTDTGEKFAWSGHFYLHPLRSEGEFSVENVVLNTYAPLYQDFVKFDVRQGIADVRAAYRFELSPDGLVAAVTNASFRLRALQIAEKESGLDVAELEELSVHQASADATARRLEADTVKVVGGKVWLRRGKDKAINLVELSKPAETAADAPGGILVLLQSVTNLFALLADSTNAWSATVHNVDVTGCAIALEDLALSRPAALEIGDITLRAREISNLPGTNMTAGLSLRWLTNGTVQTEISASLSPPSADVLLKLDQLELRPLDPYLEPQFNVFVLDSKLSLDGQVRMRTAEGELPEVTFTGDVRLDDFATVDGLLLEDLLKWRSVRIDGIEAKLNPPSVAVREVLVEEPYARLVIETNGTVNLLAALRMDNASAADTNAAGTTQAAAETSAPTAPSTNAMASLPPLTVATLVISNAQIEFTDRSVPPGVNMAIRKAGGTISGLASDASQLASVDLRASVEDVGPVEIAGAINPFRQDLTNEIRVSVRNVDLVPTSPYVGKFAGCRLAKGKLQMDVAYQVHQRKVRSSNLIVLDQFTLGERVESPDATSLPVRLAVAILKDRSGKIELDVPIEGSLDGPEFRLGKVITRAIVNIITKIATSPFAALGAVFGGRGEELSYQEFAPGSAALTESGVDKLDALAKALYERPALQVEIAGSVDPAADREALQRAALERALRQQKWMSLRRTERGNVTVDEVQLAPEERLQWVKKMYAEALEKGEIDLQSATNAVVARPRATAPSREPERGATALMQVEVFVPVVQGEAGAPIDPSQVMEDLLARSLPVSEGDLQGLAASRAGAVRDYLIQKGNVEPERVFLAETKSGVRSDGARAYLELR